MAKINKVLVTGATGFVGANLVRRLVEQNYQVDIITRQPSNKWRLEDVLSRVNSHTLDLFERDKLKRLVKKIKPEIIFHLAAAGVFGGVESSQKQLIKSNFLGTVNLIDACSEIDYQCFINTGSSSEYGSKDRPMKETDICQPTVFYGLTKLSSTLYSSLVGKTQNRPIITLRLFSPYGPYDDISRLISYAIFNAFENKDLNLANPVSVRDYIFVEDVVDLYLKAADRAAKFRGGVFNAGTGQQRTVADIVKKIIKLTNSKSKINWGIQPARPWDTKKWQANMKKTEKFLNWRSQYSIEEGLKKTIDWFRNNIKLYKNAFQ